MESTPESSDTSSTRCLIEYGAMTRAHTYGAALDRHLAAENSHDIEAILATFSESSEVVWSGRPYRGLDAIRKLHEGLGFGDAGAFSE